MAYFPYSTTIKIIDYEYLNNQIIERFDGRIMSKYYFTNENLIKAEHFKYSLENIVYKKTEIIMSNYDSSENLLKGLFFIKGAFYKAFSKNNYKKMEIKEYHLTDDEFVLTNSFFKEIYFEIDENGISELFEVECE